MSRPLIPALALPFLVAGSATALAEGEQPLLPARWEFSFTSLVRTDTTVEPRTTTQRLCLRPGAKPESLPLFPTLGGETRCRITRYSVRQPRFELIIACDEGDYGSSIVLLLERKGDIYVGSLEHNQQDRYGRSINANVTARPSGLCTGRVGG